MRVLITGGTGFVGSNLTAKLLNQGFEVRCLIRNISKAKFLEQTHAEIILGDLLNYNSLQKATENVDLVIHCAALVTDWAHRDEFFNVNLTGTKNLLDASQYNSVKRFVHISTNDVVWCYEDHIGVDENYPYPKTYKHPYSKSKAESEKIVLKYGLDKLETVIIRPCMVWGPGDYVILPRIIKLALDNELYLIGDGNNLVSLSYIDNLTDAIILGCKKSGIEGNIYFINDGLKITFKEYMKKLLNSLNVNWSPNKSVPYFLAYGLAYFYELYAKLRSSPTPPDLTRYAVALMNKNLNYSNKKAMTELEYQPKINLEQGLNNLKKWIDDIGGIKMLIKKNI